MEGTGVANAPVIHVVYFAYLYTNGEAWSGSRAQKLLLEQLRELKEFGLADVARSINVVYSIPTKFDPLPDGSIASKAGVVRTSEVDANIKSVLPNAKIHPNSGNKHEYPGIHLVWSLATDAPKSDADNTFILYFHAKGITSSMGSDNIKCSENVMFTDMVIKQWREIIARFQRDPKVNKAGYSAGRDGDPFELNPVQKSGWIWFNFWWARASYLADCPEPIITQDRYYFEEWVGRRKNKIGDGSHFGGTDDCLSLCANGVNGDLGHAFRGCAAVSCVEKCREPRETHSEDTESYDRPRNPYTFLLLFFIFVALTPNLFITFPKGADKTTIAVIHAVIFVSLVYFLQLS